MSVTEQTRSAFVSFTGSNNQMDFTKRKLFLLLLGGCGVIFILLANLLDFGSTHEVFLVAANFHNSSLSYLTSFNLNLDVLSDRNKRIKSSFDNERFRSNLDELMRNPKLNVTDVRLRYIMNKHNNSVLQSNNSVPRDSNNSVSHDSNNVSSGSRGNISISRKNSASSNNGASFNSDRETEVNSVNEVMKSVKNDQINFKSMVNKSYQERERTFEKQVSSTSSSLQSQSRFNNDYKTTSDLEFLNENVSKFNYSRNTINKGEQDGDEKLLYRGIVEHVRQMPQSYPNSGNNVKTNFIREKVLIPNKTSITNETAKNKYDLPKQIEIDGERKGHLDEAPSVKQTYDVQDNLQWKSQQQEFLRKEIDQNYQRNTGNIPHEVFQKYMTNNEQVVNDDVIEESEKGPIHTSFNALVGDKNTSNVEEFIVDPSCSRGVTSVEDILCMKRPRFLPDFRNPCWYQHGVLKCLPYFQIIGVCKTGTTDLFERLSHHPQVLKNRGILGKETWYWTWQRYGHNNFYRSYTEQMTLNDFINQFEAQSIERYTKRLVNGTLYHPAITGHGDPMDFWDQSSWKRIPQNDYTANVPKFTTPSLIKHVNPNIKLILILRDPIERLFSNYLHGQFGSTADEFHRDVILSRDLLRACTRTRSMRSCLYDEDIIRSLRVPISGSFYLIHMKEWLKVFPRKHMFITRTEAFAKNIADTLLGIFRFLRLDPLPTRDLYHIANMPHFYNTKGKETSGSIRPETRDILRPMFEPYNIELARILNDDNFNFNVIR